jgi:phage baseplate assembly protein W
MSYGMNRATGRPLGGIAHLRQSIADILTTPIGTRVLRRDYGSRLFELVDDPINRGFATELIAATAEALTRWEPRLKLTRVTPAVIEPGKVSLDLEGIYRPTGEPVRLEGIVV